jgi:hypothetical protein
MYSPKEARSAAALAARMLALGVQAESIGVIALYKAQVGFDGPCTAS